MGSATIEDACEFILLHWDEMNSDGGQREGLNLPDFDLYARDCLTFAEAESNDYITEQTPATLINCMGRRIVK